MAVTLDEHQVRYLSGEGVFGRLKFESGVHRVQRVPATEQQGRVHTSAVTVAVLQVITPETWQRYLIRIVVLIIAWLVWSSGGWTRRYFVGTSCFSSSNQFCTRIRFGAVSPPSVWPR